MEEDNYTEADYLNDNDIGCQLDEDQDEWTGFEAEYGF